jgi:hypothetical protein
MLLQGGLAIDRMCFLAGVSRAGFYRYLRLHRGQARTRHGPALGRPGLRGLASVLPAATGTSASDTS